MTNDQNAQCLCIKRKNEVSAVAKNYDLRRLSLSDIVKILLEAKAKLPPRNTPKGAEINYQQLAIMLGNRHMRTKLKNIIQSSNLIDSIEFCPACYKEPKPKAETEQERIDRYIKEIAETFKRHPDVAKVLVKFKRTTHSSSKKGKKTRKLYLFNVELILKNKEVITFTGKRIAKDFSKDELNYHSKEALWSRIANVRFIKEEKMVTVDTELAKKIFEEKMKQKGVVLKSIKAIGKDDLSSDLWSEFIEKFDLPERVPLNIEVLVPVKLRANIRTLRESKDLNFEILEMIKLYNNVQNHYVYPLTEFSYYMDHNHKNKPRRKVYGRTTIGHRFRIIPAQYENNSGMVLYPSDKDKFVCLAEFYNVLTNDTELKWCLFDATVRKMNKRDIDKQKLKKILIQSFYKRYSGHLIFGKSKVTEYKFLKIPKIIAFTYGRADMCQQLDTTFKRATKDYRLAPTEERKGMEEFRNINSLKKCIDVMKEETEKVKMPYFEWNLKIEEKDLITMNIIKKCTKRKTPMVKKAKLNNPTFGGAVNNNVQQILLPTD